MTALAHKMRAARLCGRRFDNARRLSIRQALQHLDGGVGHAGQWSYDLDDDDLIWLIASDRSLLGDAVEPHQVADSFDSPHAGYEDFWCGCGLDHRRFGRHNPCAHIAIPRYSRGYCEQSLASTHHFTLIPKNSGDAAQGTGTGVSSYAFDGAPSSEEFSSPVTATNIFAAEFNAASSEPLNRPTFDRLPLNRAITILPSPARAALEEKNRCALGITPSFDRRAV